MKAFNWTKFYRHHPLQYRDDPLLANVRTLDYSYEDAFYDIDRLLQFIPSDNVLDVGCGTGELMPYVNERAGKVTGVDFSASMCEIASERHPEFPFYVAAMHLLPFPDEEFDTVYSLGVIQHVPPDLLAASVAELLRVVKKDGKVLIGDVLESAPVEAMVYTYPKAVWQQLGYHNVKFATSYFENRLHVVIEKII